jgi:hypothetical protein
MRETQWMFNGMIVPDSYRPSRRVIDLIELGDRVRHYLEEEQR